MVYNVQLDRLQRIMGCSKRGGALRTTYKTPYRKPNRLTKYGNFRTHSTLTGPRYSLVRQRLSTTRDRPRRRLHRLFRKNRGPWGTIMYRTGQALLWSIVVCE